MLIHVLQSDRDTYLNSSQIAAIVAHGDSTKVYLADIQEPFTVAGSADDLVAALRQGQDDPAEFMRQEP